MWINNNITVVPLVVAKDISKFLLLEKRLVLPAKEVVESLVLPAWVMRI